MRDEQRHRQGVGHRCWRPPALCSVAAMAGKAVLTMVESECLINKVAATSHNRGRKLGRACIFTSKEELLRQILRLKMPKSYLRT